MENVILFDWVSITSKMHSPMEFIQILGLDKEGIAWEKTKGAHGYKDRLWWQSISIHYNGAYGMGVWLEMSGQGCRAFESYGTGDFRSLFQLVLDNPDHMNITRLDIAFDDHTGILDIDEICDDTEGQMYVSKSKSWEVTKSDSGNSVTLGSRSSEILIRIYDKAAERGFTDGRHWVRVELQLRRERARSYIGLGGDPGQEFCGVLVNYLRYVEPDGLDSNRWRWPMKKYWGDLIDGAAPIRLYSKPGLEYNMGNLETFLFDQAGAAATTWIRIYGIEKFQERLKEQPRILNAKYRQLLQEHGKL